MIVYPKEATPKLGRKNIACKTADEAIAIYRKRFAPLADDVELMVEVSNGVESRSNDSGVVEGDGVSGTTDTE